jgi:hypothetical protein
MKQNNDFIRFLTLVILMCFFTLLQAGSKNGLVQDEPVLAPDVTSAPPAVNGIGDDACWQNVPWQTIDQVWIPYDGTVTPDDYSGHYKIVWSSTTNLLYLLFEITDDAFIDGYIPGQTADVYNFDITEVFIDEDTSGGRHIFDATGSDTLLYGSNAENAFSYHIYAAYPAADQVTTAHTVDDLDGTRWGSNWRADYSAHLPDFALRKDGETAVWEFSLIVYNDTYETNNQEPARVQLQADKIFGMSVAYCDNDNADGQRDNMFGSVWEAAPGNMHWENADGYGRIKLIENPDYIAPRSKVSPSTIKLYPNPASSSMQLQLSNPYQGQVSIRVYNLLGQEVFRTSGTKTGQSFNKTLVLNHMSAGLYFVQTQIGQLMFREKLVITPWQ